MKAGGAGKRDRSPERPYWTEDVAGLLARLDSRETGLSTSEARERAGRSGPNSLRPRVRFTNLRLLARQLESPLVLILAFAAGIAAIVHDWIDAVIVLVILARQFVTPVKAPNWDAITPEYTADQDPHA